MQTFYIYIKGEGGTQVHFKKDSITNEWGEDLSREGVSYILSILLRVPNVRWDNVHGEKVVSKTKRFFTLANKMYPGILKDAIDIKK
jgi:hypothetical protein